MALYRLEAKIIGRAAKDKAGKPIPGKQISVVSKAAYRSGEKIRDERTDRTYNYKARSQEIVHAEIVAPDTAPSWITTDRSKLWNTIEQCEKRKDSQLAREFIIALPVELDREAQIEAVREWCKAEIVSKGFVADFAIHRSKNGKNPHAHILTTLRPVVGESFGKKPDTAGQWNGRGAVGKGTKSELENWRESWERHANAALEQAGRRERVDHRSLRDRGVERLPQPKLGPTAVALERKGVETRRGLLGHWTAFQNRIRSAVRAIEQTGEVKQVAQFGSGATWWERAQSAVANTVKAARELLQDASSGSRGQPQERSQEQQRPEQRSQQEPRSWREQEETRRRLRDAIRDPNQIQNPASDFVRRDYLRQKPSPEIDLEIGPM